MSINSAVVTGQPRATEDAKRKRPPLRVVPGGAPRPARAPFVVLVLLVLGVGLIGLLLLNTSLQQGSFTIEKLEQTNAKLRDKQTSLADEVAVRNAPSALSARAKAMGMTPSEDVHFLEVAGIGPKGN